MNYTTSEKSPLDEVNEGVTKIQKPLREKLERLVYFFYDEGYKLEDLAKLWGTTRQNVSLQFPKGGKK